MNIMIDYSLYLVTDHTLSKGRTTLEIVELAIKGGVTCVQLRNKEASDDEFRKEAYQLIKLTRHYSIPLIINDRVEIAQEIGAQGLHLGQSDMPLAEARNIVDKSMIIGISAETVEDAIVAEKNNADYIGISPVFQTQTKKDIAPPLGLDGIRAIRNAVNLPLVGIGGISAANAAEVIHAGADGVAVVSAIVSADSPNYASRMLLQTVQEALLSR